MMGRFTTSLVVILAFTAVLAFAEPPRAVIEKAIRARRAAGASHVNTEVDTAQEALDSNDAVSLLQGDEQPSVGQTILGAIVNTLTGAPGGISLDVIQTLFRREKSSTFGNIIKSEGFKRLNINFQMQNSRGVSDRLLMQMLDDPGMLGLTPDRFPRKLLAEATLGTVFRTLREIVADGAAGHSWNGVFIRFENNKGEFTFLIMGVRRVAPLEWDPPYKARYDFTYGITAGDFEPAPDYMVVHHSKSSFFSSKSWDELVPMQRGVTPDMLDGLLVQVLPQIVHVMAAMSNSLGELSGPISDLLLDAAPADNWQQQPAGNWDSQGSVVVPEPDDMDALSPEEIEEIFEENETDVFARIEEAAVARMAFAAGTPLAVDWNQLQLETIHAGSKQAVVGASRQSVLDELDRLMPQAARIGCTTILQPRVCADQLGNQVLSAANKNTIASFAVDARVTQFKYFNFEVRADSNALLAHVHVYAERTSRDAVKLDLAVVTVAGKAPTAYSRVTTRRCKRRCPVICKKRCRDHHTNVVRGLNGNELQTLMARMHDHGVAELRRLPGNHQQHLS